MHVISLVLFLFFFSFFFLFCLFLLVYIELGLFRQIIAERVSNNTARGLSADLPDSYI